MSVVVEAELTSLRGGKGRTPRHPPKIIDIYSHLPFNYRWPGMGGGGLEHLRDIGLTRNISEF